METSNTTTTETTTDIADGVEVQETTETTQKQEVFDASYVAKIRAEAARYRTEAKNANEKLAAAQIGTKSVEEQLAELRSQYAASELKSARNGVASEFGISTKPGKDGQPSDAELYLTASDVDGMRAQATRLSELMGVSKKNGLVVANEGANPKVPEDAMSKLLNNMFPG